jgi:hypothetical protein
VKEFIEEIERRLPDVEGRVQFLFAHSSGALLKVTLRNGAQLPHAHKRVIVLGNLVGPAMLEAHEIGPERDFADKNPKMFGD